MTTRFLKTTTAIALVVGLANPIAAQGTLDLSNLSNLDPQAALEIIMEQRAAAEADGDTARIAELDALAQQIEAEANAAPADAPNEAAESAAPAEPAAPAAPDSAPEAEVEAEAAAEAEAEAEVDIEAEVEAEAEAAPVDAEPDNPLAEGTDQLEQALQGAADSEDAEAQGAAEAEAEAEAEAAPAAEAEAEAEPAPAGEADAAPVAEDAPAPAADAETAPAAEADNPLDAGREQLERALQSGSGQEAATADAEVAAPDPQAQADAIAEDDAATSAAAAAAGNDASGGEPEVVEETVTEDNARASDEEFETTIQQGDAAAQAETGAGKKDKDKDDDRQEELLRGAGAALLGLGALAVGDMLRPDEEVVSNTGDRIVVERDGQFRVLRNDDALLRQPGSNVTTYRYDDGSTRNVVLREDGSEIETIRARDGRVLRRTRTLPSGESFVLFDDTEAKQEVVVNELPQVNERRVVNFRDVSEDDLGRALLRLDGEQAGRAFSLNQVRNIDQVRKLMPEINVDTVNFETGSAVIRPEEAEELRALGRAIRDLIADNPGEVFLIEGHTDAVGGAGYNLALSDRRAESVALALTEYFDVPPENMVIQGYGESDLLVATQDGERANRRAAVRRITPLLQASR